MILMRCPDCSAAFPIPDDGAPAPALVRQIEAHKAQTGHLQMAQDVSAFLRCVIDAARAPVAQTPEKPLDGSST